MNFLLDWFHYSADTWPSMLQGFAAALILLLFTLLVRRLPAKWRWPGSALLLVVITPLATLGFWFSTGDLGISDWDYYFSLHHTNRQTILEHHQLPFWNPYICGGTAGIADPEFRFFTPTYLLQLIFGIPVGFRLAIWLATATGAIGVLFLGKRINLSREASTLAATIATFGSVTLLEIVEGHPNVFAAMYIPWIFWAWLGAYRAHRHTAWVSKWHIITAVFLALTFFQGGIYLLMYTAIAFLVLPLLVRRHKDALKVSVLAGIIALGLAAIKLVPVLLWLAQFQDKAYASSALTLPYLHEIFLGRYLHGAEDVIPNQGSGWHEYGAYIGPIAILLAALGSFAHWRSRVARSLIVATAFAILLSGTGPALKPLFDQAAFLPRSNISRIVLFAVIPLSLLAGLGVQSIQRTSKKSLLTHIVAPLILFVVAIDLFTLSYPLSEQAFVLPHVDQPPEPAPSPIAYAMYDFKTRHNGVDYNRAYEATLQGYGTFAYCAVLGPGTEYSEPVVRTIHDEGDNKIIAIQNENNTGSFTLSSWTPNKVQATVSVSEPSDILLNTNYALGWQINQLPAKDIAGRVGVSIKEPGEYSLTFQYVTPGFVVGSGVSGLTTAAILALVFYRRYRRDEHTDSASDRA